MDSFTESRSLVKCGKGEMVRHPGAGSTPARYGRYPFERSCFWHDYLGGTAEAFSSYG